MLPSSGGVPAGSGADRDPFGMCGDRSCGFTLDMGSLLIVAMTRAGCRAGAAVAGGQLARGHGDRVGDLGHAADRAQPLDGGADTRDRAQPARSQ
jgi:hypothetical protein